MSLILNKADENRLAAKVLIENNYYSASVHSSYYSILQYMKHLLLSKVELTEEDLKAKMTSEKTGMHRIIRQEISATIKDARDTYPEIRGTFVTYRSLFNDLKTFRENSDYYEVMISKDNANKALSKSVELRTLLKETFLQIFNKNERTSD